MQAKKIQVILKWIIIVWEVKTQTIIKQKKHNYSKTEIMHLGRFTHTILEPHYAGFEEVGTCIT